MSKCQINCSNCFSSKIGLYNRKTQKFIKPHCRTYTCPTHGWKKQADLRAGIEKWLSQFKHIRMYTFTIRNTGEYSNEDFNYLFTKVWHHFLVSLRRSKLLSTRERGVQYIKVYELHKLGTLHVHALMSEFIHWSRIQTIWEESIKVYFRISGKQGNVHIRGSRNAKSGARYVAKYVTKMAKEGLSKVRSWSKSGKVAIFAKRVSTGKWAILRKGSLDYKLAKLGIPILVGRVSCVTENRRITPKKYEHPRLFVEYWNYLYNIFTYI